MNQPQRIFKSTVALTAADLAERAGNILLAFVIARMTHAGGLGIYFGAIAFFGLIAAGGGLGATSFLVREVAKNPSKTGYYVTHLSVMGTAVSLLIAALFLAALPHLGFSAELTTAIGVVIVAVPAAVVKTLQRAVFIAHQRVTFVTYTVIASTLVNFSVCIYLLVQGYGIVSLLATLVILEYASVAVYFYLINRFIAPLSWRFGLTNCIRLLGEIKSFAALSVLGALFTRPEVILLSFLRDEVEVGLYIAALKVVNLCYFLPGVYMTNVFPVLSRSYHESAQKFRFIQDTSIKYLLVVSLPLTVGTVVVAEPIIDLLYGPGFETSVLLLQILMWSLPIQAMTAVLWRVLAARNQQSLDLRARAVGIIVRLGGGYLLISSLASLGASMSVLAGLLVNGLLLVHYVNREGARLQFSRLGWRCALAAMGMGVVAWTLAYKLQLWAVVPLAVAVYAALAVVFRVFSPEDVALFRKTWEPAMIDRD